MPANLVFIDTAALLGLVNRDDSLHDAAKRVEQQLAAEKCPLLTSDWVLAEFLGGAARPLLRNAAAKIVRRLNQSRRVTIVPAAHADWQRGFELFESRSDKQCSLVDCISILI